MARIQEPAASLPLLLLNCWRHQTKDNKHLSCSCDGPSSKRKFPGQKLLLGSPCSRLWGRAAIPFCSHCEHCIGLGRPMCCTSQALPWVSPCCLQTSSHFQHFHPSQKMTWLLLIPSKYLQLLEKTRQDLLFSPPSVALQANSHCVPGHGSLKAVLPCRHTQYEKG